MMRRGWVIAGALILAVPSVPMAVSRLPLVLDGVDEPGKWMRTGDVERFRVRVNGIAAADARPTHGAGAVPAETKVKRHGSGALRPALSSVRAAEGAAPWPWEPVAARKPVRQPAGRTDSPDRAMELSFVTGGMGVLLGALWWIGTVQRRRKRKT
ncbi:hypothetical protein [Nonomuraea sp. NPDC049695]|uniref:hypothetical protein n=1 Tax=Nonomuraea sp. NPDC049695 TaxID=3154734 RepID=UPI0034483503